MKDEKGLGNVTHPSYGIGGMGPHNELFPNSIIKEEHQNTNWKSGQHRKINEIFSLIHSPRSRVCSSLWYSKVDGISFDSWLLAMQRN